MVIYEGSPGDAHSSSCSVAVCVVCNQHLATWSWHTAVAHHTHGLLLQALPGWPLTEAIYNSRFIQVTSDCVNAKYIMHAKSHGPSPQERQQQVILPPLPARPAPPRVLP